MPTTSQEALLQAINLRGEIFEMFEDMFASDNYHRVLMAYEGGMTYQQISDKADVGTGTVSRAMDVLVECGFILDTDEGKKHSLPVLNHPIIQYYYWERYEDE